MKVLFEGFGVSVVRSEFGLFARYDSGESAGSRLVESAITEEEFTKLKLSEQDAYSVLVAARARKSAQPVD